jgi:hypothetical protein
VRKIALPFLALVLIALPSISQTLVGVPHGPNDPGTCSYLSSSGCQDKAVFNTSSFDSWFGRWIYFSAQNSRILVDVKYDSNSDGTLDSWRWGTSKVVVDMGMGSTVALGVVLANANFTYYNPQTQRSYKRVMYFIYQGPNDPAAGRLCLSYSDSANDANDWTTPIAAIFSTTSSTLRGRACSVANAEVLTESASGFQFSSTEIDLFGLHGDIAVLSGSVTSSATGGNTETYLLKAAPLTPDVIQVQAMTTSNGMFTPTISGGDHDYYFRNLDATYDAAAGRVYLLRVTPYPFDVSRTDIPCAGGCPGGLATFPLRGQIYYMNVGSDISKTTSSAQSWTLARDIGRSTGWSYRNASNVCVELPATTSPQENLGVDLDSLTIHKTPDGLLQKSGTNLTLFMGAWKNINRKQSCVNAKTANMGADNPGGTWIDAELYELTSPVP